jgi:hypothetical protein
VDGGLGGRGAGGVAGGGGVMQHCNRAKAERRIGREKQRVRMPSAISKDLLLP